MDADFKHALSLPTLSEAEAFLQEHQCTEFLRLRASFRSRWADVHEDSEAAIRGSPPQTELPGGRPLGTWCIPSALVQWANKHKEQPMERCNLFLWDDRGGLGKSIWARTLGFHNLISGAACMDMFTRAPELRIYDDLEKPLWDRIFKNKRLHQPGEEVGVRVGAYSKEMKVLGCHSIFLMNYDPELVIKPEDMEYWKAQATWVKLSSALWLSSTPSPPPGTPTSELVNGYFDAPEPPSEDEDAVGWDL